MTSTRREQRLVRYIHVDLESETNMADIDGWICSVNYGLLWCLVATEHLLLRSPINYTHRNVETYCILHF